MIAGNGPPPALVWLLVQRLPDDSLTAALASGGVDHLGWGHDRHLLASVYDAINANTRATGQWRKKPPKIAAWPRPKTKKSTSDKSVTVAQLHARLQNGG